MCRHLAYVGRPVLPADAVLDGPHSLRVQSYAPNDMRCGAVANADGFGVGWYGADGVHRYRRDCPLWTDQGVEAVTRTVPVTGFLAAARSATVGMPVVETACAPFTEGTWLFSHNGMVRGWPGALAAVAARELSTVDMLTLEAPTDSAVLWALLRRRLALGEEPAAALADLVTAVDADAPGSRLNLLLTDGSTIYATTWSHALSVRRTETGVLVASEPLDEHPEWTPVDDHRVLVATATTIDIAPLPRVTRTRPTGVSQ